MDLAAGRGSRSGARKHVAELAVVRALQGRSGMNKPFRWTLASMMILRVGAVGALVACDPVVEPPVVDPPPATLQTVVEVPATPNRDLDLLFVVDDSPSMLDKQTNLTANFPSFLDRLQAVPGGLPNLHVGVVTTDMGTKASGSSIPGPSIGQIGQGGCSGTGKSGVLQIGDAPVNGRFLVDLDAPGGGRTQNYSGTLADAFGAMARAGAGGCGFEQPLAAMRAALDNNAANAGFLRPEAMLGVVFLADEDDCSAKSTTLFGPETGALGPLQSFRCARFGVTCAQGGQTPDTMNQVGTKAACAPSATSELLDDVAPYREFLRGLKPDERRLAVTGILGPVDPFAVELRTPPGGGSPFPSLAHSCTYAGPVGTEVADPAIRLKSFLDGFQGRSGLTSICERDLSTGLVQLAEVFRKALGSPCVDAELADANPETAGLQANCVVEDVVGANAIEIESCERNLTARPCWRLEADPALCTELLNLKLVVQRDAALDPTAVTRMRCTVAE
jgi:hypothetical protein